MEKTRQILTTIISSLIILNFCIESAQAQVWVGDYRIHDSGDIAALSGYTEITGTLYFHSNVLTSLTGLDSLTSIGGSLMTYENYDLTSLNGLENLTSVGRGVEIIWHTELTNLCALYNLRNLSWLCIIANPMLAMDMVYALETHVRANGFTGTATIGGNEGTEQIFCDIDTDTDNDHMIGIV